jgi:predicted phage gp36 major capsid-like protein
VQRIATNSDESFSDPDRQELVTFIAENTDQSEAEAQELVNNLEQTYQEIRAETQQAVDQAQAAGQEALNQAEQTARQTGEAVANNVASAAIWTFIGLLLSAIAAAIGGYIAAPRMVRT